MRRKVTDEHIARVATQLISARNGKLAAKKKRRELMSVEGGFCENFHGSRLDALEPENCYGANLDPPQFCDPCKEVHNACFEVKQATARATGKLRTLTSIINRKFDW